MEDKDKSKSQLILELDELRRRNAELEARESEFAEVSQALQRSEATFKRLAEKAVVGVYLIQDDIFKYVNPKMAQILGYDVEELQDIKGPQAVVFPEDWPLVRENLRKRISGEVEAIHFQFRGIRKDGQVIHAEVHGSRTDEGGRPAVIGTLIDISERIRAREERQQELAKFQALYELAVAMTAERELDENLELIVETSRKLLQADTSFLALKDNASNELCMRTLSGIVTDEFRNLRIPWGVGLGGKVAESGKLVVVADYIEEIDPAFHDIVQAEGLVSGAAVPVQSAGRNVGVLYVFDRSETPFSESELATLSMLGNLAAVEITRKGALERLQDSEQQFRTLYEDSKRREELYHSLLNSSPDAIVIYDMAGRTQYVNPSFIRTFGWTLEELEGKLVPFVPDAERDATTAEIERIVKQGTPISAFETKRYTKGGEILDISISASRFHDHQGNPAGVVGILRDITDRKRADEALRFSEEKYRDLYEDSEKRKRQYRTLLDVSPDPIVVYDMEGVPSYTNPAFTRVFGWTFEEVEGKRLDFVPEKNWPETHDMISTVVKGGSFTDRETRRYTKGGRLIDVSISGAAFLDKDGIPSGSVVHLRDITPRKQTEAHLAAELKKFQGLYDLSLAMTAGSDLDESLALIVEKSKGLLGTDTAFIALRDEATGDLFMHTLSGIVTKEFSHLRIPMGEGLGGQVAQTARLRVVGDYLEEIGGRFQEVALAEGIVSGIAVPIHAGRTNLGVLYVFNRSKTHFSQSDLDTLSLMGNLAAVEITRRHALDRLGEREESYRNLYEEAKRREELYRSLLNSSADAIVIYDLEGLPQYISPSFTRIFGWTLEDLEGRKIPFVPDEELDRSLAMIGTLINDGVPCSRFETKRFTKDGRILDISISASRYLDHEGTPAGILAILRDITERKRAEAALKESEERLRTLVEVAPMGLVVINPDETTLYINPKFTELFGYARRDLPDLATWFRTAYATERAQKKAEAVWKNDKTEIRKKHGIGVEGNPRVFKIKTKDGSSRIVSFRAVVLADGRVIATFLDVTSEVEAQQEILRAKNEWERTFNSVSDLIIILDSDRHILRANRAVADRLGTPPAQLVGMDDADVRLSDRFPVSLCPDPSVLEEGRDYSAEVFDEALGGVFDLRVSPLRDDEGRLLGSVNVARDITAFKSMERARSLAVHHLSHELRTPVSIIKGSVKDLAQDNLPRGGRERRVERIRRSLRRLSEIQDTVQEVVSPRPYRPAHFPIVPVLDELLEEIRQQSSHRLVELVTELEPMETDIIDPKVFRDAINTLVKNAIENTPDQGQVVIRLKKVPAGVLLQVEDQGVGIQWSDREFVFEAFHHTQDTAAYSTKRPFDFDAGGKGLELMRLKILSEEGAFNIYFETQRCRYLGGVDQVCPGRIDVCTFINGVEECKQSGGTTFSILFRDRAMEHSTTPPRDSLSE